MRVISLNTWCGRSLYPLMHFFRDRSEQADVFCLQEVLDSEQRVADQHHPGEFLCGTLLPKIAAELPDFQGMFARFDDNPDRMSLALFVRRHLAVRAAGDIVVHRYLKPQETGSAVLTHRKLQYAVLDCGGRDVFVGNFHGLWAGPKTDNADRLAQSRHIVEFMDKFDVPKVLCGDFNLLPETESLRIIERDRMRNLVKDFKIGSTRTRLYRHYDDPAEPNFADYALVSPEIVVDKFEVLPDVVSDHSPLYLEFHCS